MEGVELKHSDYVVYVDESGDHSLISIDEGYPVFVLSFCIFQKTYYSHGITPALRMLKFTTFGHDMVILHEQDIRKKTGKLSGDEQKFYLGSAWGEKHITKREVQVLKHIRLVILNRKEKPLAPAKVPQGNFREVKVDLKVV